MSVFLEIDADKQTTTIAGEIHQAGQEFARRLRVEIANGRSRKINNAAGRELSRQRQFERLEIICGYRQYLQRWKLLPEARARFFQLLLRNVDRDVNDRFAKFFE